MPPVSSHNGINDLAAYWAVEMAHGDMTAERRLELDAWLAADRRHQGAFVRARAWLIATEEAVVGPDSGPSALTTRSGEGRLENDVSRDANEWTPAPIRRRISSWSGGALAASVALVVAITGLFAVDVSAPVNQAKPASTPRLVTLKDGSIANLGDDAKIQVDISDNSRMVTLLSGHAVFKVAKDPARPFVVRTGDIFAQATGTVYSVNRIGATGGRVNVMEGSVMVWARDERDQAVLLRAGGTVTLDPGPRPLKQNAAGRTLDPLPPPALAQISLDNVSIKDAVVRFNRVNATQIVVTDPEIADVKIVGLYRSSDPLQFALAAAEITGAEVENLGNVIVIKMKQ